MLEQIGVVALLGVSVSAFLGSGYLVLRAMVRGPSPSLPLSLAGLTFVMVSALGTVAFLMTQPPALCLGFVLLGALFAAFVAFLGYTRSVNLWMQGLPDSRQQNGERDDISGDSSDQD